MKSKNKIRIRFLFLLLVASFFSYIASAQVPRVNTHSRHSLPRISDPKISNDGKFVGYIVRSENEPSVLVIQTVDGIVKRKIDAVENFEIADDNSFIFSYHADSIGIVDPKDNSLNIIRDGNSLKIVGTSEGVWLAYQRTNPEKGLILTNLKTKRNFKFKNVIDYTFSYNGSMLFLLTSVKEDSSFNGQNIVCVHVVNGQSKIIWRGSKAWKLICSKNDVQLAFFCEEKENNQKINAIRYFAPGLDSTVILIDTKTRGIPSDLMPSVGYNGRNLPFFSDDGKMLYIGLKNIPQTADNILKSQNASVDVWNYQDLFLQSQQLHQEVEKTITAVVDISKKLVVPINNLEDDGNEVFTNNSCNARYALIKSTKGESREWNWRSEAKPSLCLISLETGLRKSITKGILTSDPILSPDGKYVIYYDREKKNYFSYNTINNDLINVSGRIKQPLYDDEDDHPQPPQNFGIGGWIEGGNELLIYDRYDIWKISLDERELPVNITHFYGKNNRTILRILNVQGAPAAPIFKNDDELILDAFNRNNKDNGFFYLQLGNGIEPKKLTMGKCLYHGDFNRFLPRPNLAYTPIQMQPIKAKKSNEFIVQKMSAKESPELYATSDFEHFIRLTNNTDVANTASINSELVRWRLPDGNLGEGILYKPENFNPNKKYPVIIYFYEQNANTLNLFIYLQPSIGIINIPAFVGDGYLVFVPNIYYKIGSPGKSVQNSVMSAVNWLLNNHWVDKNKIGLQGHSFGGYEVNYLITQTKLFAAASSSAGVSDLISFYGSLREGWNSGWSNQYMSETAQTRIGTTLWQNKEAYIRNSPIFYVDKVSTPLLIMHNATDGSVPFSQGVELFTGLRRLKKPCWLLQYDNENFGHQLSDLQNQLDFSNRMMQFFDHYLKGAPPPKWMTVGIPARLKGIETGYELDPNGSCGKDCKICKEKKYDK